MHASTKTEAILLQLLERHGRVIVAGGTGTGKTTTCQVVTDRPVVHTDDWAPASKTRAAGPRWRPGLNWSNTPAAIVSELPDGPLVIEGARGIGLMRAGAQVDCLLWLRRPVKQLDATHLASWRGRETDFSNWIDAGEVPPGVHVQVVE